ncbi:hypothetical protein PPACK8108_LOCUS11027 [Phakopsora pachyrhizi]|uniref:Uncharacterized protein n=1 Tax=Phakopsora pachyrhizi TaxID=170000 RepID=A0AAV0B205_PHAPC|nr:hypothetical protein PPACK8108_LOCUS11027 [Phakopsora pachyrhizi]
MTIHSLEVETSLTILVSPLVAVLAMAIGCSILDDSGSSDYQPLYMACRMAAVGGPIAALICVLFSFTFLDNDDSVEESIEIISARRKLYNLRFTWGLITPYLIGILGAPIGSAILRSAELSNTISPLSAVRAAAVGGIFSVAVYYIFIYLAWCFLKPCLILSGDDSSIETEVDYPPRFV